MDIDSFLDFQTKRSRKYDYWRDGKWLVLHCRECGEEEADICPLEPSDAVIVIDRLRHRHVKHCRERGVVN